MSGWWKLYSGNNAYGYINAFLSNYLKTDMTWYELMRIRHLQNGSENKKLKNVEKRPSLCNITHNISYIKRLGIEPRSSQ